MSDTPNTVRMNISVPADVKSGLDQIEGLNMSGIATEAFRKTLVERAAQTPAASIDAAVARMKAADEIDDAADRDAGTAAGRSWAMDDATPKQLRRLERAVEAAGAGAGYYANSADFATEFVRDVFRGDDRSNVSDFWETVTGDRDWEDTVTGAFGEGFVQAALDAWADIEAKL